MGPQTGTIDLQACRECSCLKDLEKMKTLQESLKKAHEALEMHTKEMLDNANKSSKWWMHSFSLPINHSTELYSKCL